MVFELYGARVRNLFAIRAFAGMRFRKLLRKIEHGEQDFDHALEIFQKSFHEGGVIEEAESAVLDLIKKEEKEEARVLKLEEQTVVYMFTTFEEIFKGMQETQQLGQALSKHQQQFSEQTRAQAQKIYQEIALLFRKDADETYDMLLQLARVFRDQYDALQETADGKLAKQRLRDMMGQLTVVFKDFKEKRTARRATKEAKRIHKDVHAEEKVMKELEHILSNMHKHFDEKTFIKDLNKLEHIFKDESDTITNYLEDTRMYLLLTVRHYFIILEHIFETNKEIDFLRNDGFSQKSLTTIDKQEEQTIKKLLTKSLTVMREMYQLYNKMKQLREGAQQVRKQT